MLIVVYPCLSVSLSLSLCVCLSVCLSVCLVSLLLQAHHQKKNGPRFRAFLHIGKELRSLGITYV